MSTYLHLLFSLFSYFYFPVSSVLCFVFSLCHLSLFHAFSLSAPIFLFLFPFSFTFCFRFFFLFNFFLYIWIYSCFVHLLPSRIYSNFSFVQCFLFLSPSFFMSSVLCVSPFCSHIVHFCFSSVLREAGSV